MRKSLLDAVFPVTFRQALRERAARIFARQAIPPVADLQSLQDFLDTRASHVTQTALYGYLRTRAGARFPELFANDDFAKAINAAKWNIWVACVSDLAVYAGGRLHAATGGADTARVMRAAIDGLLERTGVPTETDAAFAGEVLTLRERLRSCEWGGVADSEAAFSTSPGALVRWAPIMDELKQLDEEIVRNSVRFRWQEVRQELRRLLDAEAVMAAVRADQGVMDP